MSEPKHEHESGCGCACPLHPGACCECLCAVHDVLPEEAPAAAPTPVPTDEELILIRGCQVAEHSPGVKLWICGACIRAAIQKAVEEREEECCKAVCQWCDLGDFDGHTNQVTRGLEGWHHKVEPPLDDSQRIYFRCDAGAIRARERRG